MRGWAARRWADVVRYSLFAFDSGENNVRMNLNLGLVDKAGRLHVSDTGWYPICRF